MSDEEYAINFPTSQQRGKSNDEKYSRYSTEEIIRAYRTQAKSVFASIEAFIECEITEKNDYIIEGYHIEPTLVVSLQEKYPGMIRSLFLIKSNQGQFIQDILKSTTPNDWIITRTTNPEIF